LRCDGCACLQGLGLRITEAGTFYGGGINNVSNSYAAALWTADWAFEMAAAGAAGVNLHWSSGRPVEDGGSFSLLMCWQLRPAPLAAMGATCTAPDCMGLMLLPPAPCRRRPGRLLQGQIHRGVQPVHQL
jgi:hypothetical protein